MQKIMQKIMKNKTRSAGNLKNKREPPLQNKRGPPDNLNKNTEKYVLERQYHVFS